MLPKLNVVGVTLKPAAEPLPDRLMVSGEPGASLLIFTVPATAPAEVGANLTLKFADFDGSNVSDVDTPVTLNPVPAAATLDI